MRSPLDLMPNARGRQGYASSAVTRIKGEARRAGMPFTPMGLRFFQHHLGNLYIPRPASDSGGTTYDAVVHHDIQCPDDYGNCSAEDTYAVTLGSQTVNVHRDEIAVRRATLTGSGTWETKGALIVAKAMYLYNADCLAECEPHLTTADPIKMQRRQGTWWIVQPWFLYFQDC